MKDQPFAPSVNYIGFTCDIENQIVALSASKVAKYVEAIDNWKNWVAQTLIKVQGMYRKLVDVAYALPTGWAFLMCLECMLKVCSCQDWFFTDLIFWGVRGSGHGLVVRPKGYVA